MKHCTLGQYRLVEPIAKVGMSRMFKLGTAHRGGGAATMHARYRGRHEEYGGHEGSEIADVPAATLLSGNVIGE